MARIRTIKPEFWTSEQVMELSIPARLAFIGIWNFSDDAGVHPASPKTLKARVFASDDFATENVGAMVAEMIGHGLVAEFEVDGKPYWHVTGWARHQKIDKPTYRHPSPPDVKSSATLRTLDESSSNTPRAIDDPSPTEGNGRETKGTETAASPAGDTLACPVEDIIAMYHEAMPTNPRCKVLNASRRGAIKARWLEASRLECKPFGYDTRADGLDAWRTFFETCNESAFLTGQAPPQPGKPPFLADIDFLMSPSGFAKCLENKYHREAA